MKEALTYMMLVFFPSLSPFSFINEGSLQIAASSRAQRVGLIGPHQYDVTLFPSNPSTCLSIKVPSIFFKPIYSANAFGRHALEILQNGL